jgi:murein DD-endopeptidase MepM/ murein hydrolase activator NlpD
VPANDYKRFEKEVVDSLGKRLRLFFSSLISFFRFVFRKGRQRFTVMFIPHSEKKIFNFHISVFALVFVFVLLVVLVISFFGLSTHFTTSSRQITEYSANLQTAETDLDSLKDEVNRVERVWKQFRHEMGDLLQFLGSEESERAIAGGVGGDLSSFLSVESFDDGYSREISELRSLTAYLSNISEPIHQMADLLKAQKELLVDIPTLWPVSGGRGNMTAMFGVEEHPFTRGFRLHNGVDIAWSPGTPVLATANGKVQSVVFEPNGLGNKVTIRHNYGFTTIYGHLSKAAVRKGQNVARGQTVGYIGNTGLSTGPHVHYEVWIGTQVVDPMYFLDLKSPLVEKFSSSGR